MPVIEIIYFSGYITSRSPFIFEKKRNVDKHVDSEYSYVCLSINGLVRLNGVNSLFQLLNIFMRKHVVNFKSRSWTENHYPYNEPTLSDSYNPYNLK